MDIKKAIKGLECCSKEEEISECKTCPYFNDFTGCIADLKKDLLEILREVAKRGAE
jgi:hypothetical protein